MGKGGFSCASLFTQHNGRRDPIPFFLTFHSRSDYGRVLRPDIIFFKDSFLPAVISEWNSLNIDIWNSSSINVFKKELLKFIRPEPNSTYNINDTKGLKLLTRLRLGLSHLGDHKFRHNFQDCVSLCVIVVKILKQQLSSSFTAIIIIVQGKPSFTR